MLSCVYLLQDLMQGVDKVLDEVHSTLKDDAFALRPLVWPSDSVEYLKERLHALRNFCSVIAY